VLTYGSEAYMIRKADGKNEWHLKLNL
jgi:hypothetical protein